MRVDATLQASARFLIALCAFAFASSGWADAPGRFDYYVLSLSWSPQYCAQARADEPQCARPYAFVVHGLWPQFARGYPGNCPSNARVDEATIAHMLPIMPSRSLIVHEWRAHGACAGNAPGAYFANVERSYRSIVVPAAYSALDSYLSQDREQVRRAFVTSNPRLPASAIRLQCAGRYLQEVQVCLTRDRLAPRACAADVRDRCGAKLVFRPVR